MPHSLVWQEQEAERISQEASTALIRLKQHVDYVDLKHDTRSLSLTELKEIQEQVTHLVMLVSQLMVLE